MARQVVCCRRARGARPARSGFTLLEVVFTLAILVIAILSTSATSISLSALRRENRERSVAHNAAAACAERIQSIARAAANQPGAWGRNVVDAVCPPGSLTAVFDVKELTPEDGQSHVGSLRFVADETQRDSALGVELGMPHDLDGDGAADNPNVLQTAHLLPVIVELEWKGIRGNQRIVHPFWVVGY